MTTLQIREETLIPDLLQQAPQVRPVLDRYGLRGCGGPLGPRESLAFFARAHDVPVPRLLADLRAKLDQTSKPEPPPPVRPQDSIYRPFFKAGIGVALTLGAAWGAYLLTRIAWAENFVAAGLHEVNAHGHAQIFGWVGLFVMGFAYQAFPRFKHTELAHPRMALTSGLLMLLGLMVRSLGEPLVAFWPWLFVPVVAAAWVEVVAIALFVGVILRTWQGSGRTLAFYDKYILCALAWFVVQAIYEAIYLAATLSVDDRAQLLALVATWQAPLRDIQIHGFALLMILGVSQRMFHNFYGLPAPNPRLSLKVLPVLNVAILGEAAGLTLMRVQHHAWGALWYASSLILAAAAIVLVSDWSIFSNPKESDRSLKFLRTAYGWLFLSLAMVLFLPVYQFGLLPTFAPEAQAAQTGFSHAYYGAVRHAITVGFISLMIVGVASKVVPTLNGVDGRTLPSLWLPFVFLNLGCALRVSGQVLTDFWPGAFPFTGVSGCLEVTGLALWGVHLWRVMGGRGTSLSGPAAVLVDPHGPLVAAHLVSEVLEQHPHLLETFVAAGFKPLASPWLRKTLAARVTVGQACRLAGVDAEQFLQRLNQDRTLRDEEKVSLPVLP